MHDLTSNVVKKQVILSLFQFYKFLKIVSRSICYINKCFLYDLALVIVIVSMHNPIFGPDKGCKCVTNRLSHSRLGNISFIVLVTISYFVPCL